MRGGGFAPCCSVLAVGIFVTLFRTRVSSFLKGEAVVYCLPKVDGIEGSQRPGTQHLGKARPYVLHPVRESQLSRVA